MAATQSIKLELLLRGMDPGKFSSYQEFMRALLIEALANTNFTFDELSYNLYALNKVIFTQLNRETTAFFKLLANRRPDVILVLLHKDKKQASAWTQSFMMEPCNSLDPILGHVDPSIVQG